MVENLGAFALFNSHFIQIKILKNNYKIIPKMKNAANINALAGIPTL